MIKNTMTHEISADEVSVQERTARIARADLLVQTFVQLSDSLVDNFDIIELLSVLADRCVALFDAAAAGILLADSNRNLRVIAASSESARLLELFQLQNDEGPCLECYKTGIAVSVDDLKANPQWPLFVPEALAAGFQSVYAVPLRLRTNVLGALNLFRNEGGPMAGEDLRAAQALADVSSVAMLQDNAASKAGVLVGELQHALDSRVLIEQAKGMIAEWSHADMNESFRYLREYARSNNRALTDVAESVVSGSVPIGDIARK
jgi:GAF domain-containing protein